MQEQRNQAFNQKKIEDLVLKKITEKCFQFQIVDFFAVPFQFNIENNGKKKQTEIGGVLTFIVYSLSMAYLVINLNLYFNGIDPKISTTTLNSNQDNNYDFNESTLGFGFFIYSENDTAKSLLDIEKEKGKKYLIFQTQYQYFDDNGVYKVKKMKQKHCSNNNDLKGYLCFDFSEFEGQKINLKYNFQSTSIFFEGFSIFVERCENSPDCADSKDIEQIIYSLQNLIKVAIKTSRYNTFNNNYDSYYMVDGYAIDTIIGESRQYSLVQSRTTLISGMLFQTKKQTSYFDNVKQISEIHSLDYIKDQQKTSIKTLIRFRLSQEIQYINIQYPQITEILAQSMSIFGILLVIGQFGYTLSEIKQYQGISNIFLQVYYKRTANKILNYFFEKNDSQKNKKMIQHQKHQMQSQISKKTIIQDSKINSPETDQQNNSQQESQDILQSYFQISNSFFPNIFFKSFKLNIFQKIYILFKKKISNTALKQNSEQFKNINSIIMNTKQMNNVYYFFREFIKIKMIVRLLLTKEQFAAIQCCGVDAQNIDDMLLKKVDIPSPIIRSDFQQPQQAPQREDEKLEFISKNTVQNIEQINSDYNSDKILKVSPSGTQQLKKEQQLQQLSNENLQEIKSPFPQKQEQDNQQEKIGIDVQQIELTNNIKNTVKSSNITLQMQDPNTSIQQSQQSFSQSNDINHLEILECIDKDDTYLSVYLEKFIDQMKNNQHKKSELDNRIYSCIVSQHSSKKQ